MQTGQRLERIATLSRRLRWAFRAIVILVVVAGIAVVAGLASGNAQLDIDGNQVELDGLDPASRFVLLGVLLPLLGLMGALLYQIDRLLALYERRVVFAPENGQRIRVCGQLMIALAVIESVVGPLMLMVAEALGAETHDLTVDVNPGLLLGGVFVLVIGHVMAVGAEISEDQALTI